MTSEIQDPPTDAANKTDSQEAKDPDEQNPIVEGIRAELQRLIDLEPFTPGVVNRIKKVASKSHALMLTIDPSQKNVSTQGGLVEDYDSDDGGRDYAEATQGNVSAPFSGPETFGASALRELVPMLTKMLGPKIPEVEVSKEPDDWESTGSLVLAYKQANDACLTDVAAGILARIKARTDPDVKKAVEEAKRKKALVHVEGTPERAEVIDALVEKHVGAPDESFAEDLVVSNDSSEPILYCIRDPGSPETAFSAGPFKTIDEAFKHKDASQEVVEMPSGFVVYPAAVLHADA